MGDDDKNTFEREREIFFAALEKMTEESRAGYLQETCGDDAAMLTRVREMLENHGGDETETFLKASGIPELVVTLMNDFTPTRPQR